MKRLLIPTTTSPRLAKRPCKPTTELSMAVLETKLFSAMRVPELKQWLVARGVRGLSKLNRPQLIELAEKTAKGNDDEDDAAGSSVRAMAKRDDGYDAFREWHRDYIEPAPSPWCSQRWGESATGIQDIALELVRTVESLLDMERSNPTIKQGWRAEPASCMPRSGRVRYPFYLFTQQPTRRCHHSLYLVLPQAIARMWLAPRFLWQRTTRSCKLLELVAAAATDTRKTTHARYGARQPLAERTMLDDLVRLYPALRDTELRRLLAQSLPRFFSPLRKMVLEYWLPAADFPEGANKTPGYPAVESQGEGGDTGEDMEMEMVLTDEEELVWFA